MQRSQTISTPSESTVYEMLLTVSLSVVNARLASTVIPFPCAVVLAVVSTITVFMAVPAVSRVWLPKALARASRMDVRLMV